MNDRDLRELAKSLEASEWKAIYQAFKNLITRINLEWEIAWDKHCRRHLANEKKGKRSHGR